MKSNVVWIPYSHAETEISFLYVFDLLFIVDSVSFHSSRFFQFKCTVFAILPGEAVLAAKLLAKKKTQSYCPVSSLSLLPSTLLYSDFSCVNIIVLYMPDTLGV